MYYFDEKKEAFCQPIQNAICSISDDLWLSFGLNAKLGREWDIIDGEFVNLRQTPEYQAAELAKAKEDKNNENTAKAKLAIENGYVEYKDAEFETNAQTVGDLTATMLLMQATGLETYTWLSKDDKEVELTVQDFGILGGLIADYKGEIWQIKYLNFKTQIENAETAEEVNAIVINYAD